MGVSKSELRFYNGGKLAPTKFSVTPQIQFAPVFRQVTRPSSIHKNPALAPRVFSNPSTFAALEAILNFFARENLMKSSNKLIAGLALTLLLSACTSPRPKKFESLSLGQTKSDVIDLIGNPKISKREKGRDFWIFSYFEGEQEFRKSVEFEKGKVVKLSPTRPFPDPESEIEKAGSLQEFEEKGRLLKKNPDEGFKDVDGGKDE